MLSPRTQYLIVPLRFDVSWIWACGRRFTVALCCSIHPALPDRCAYAEHRKEKVKIIEGTFGITINSGESLVKIVPNSLPWLAVCIDRHISFKEPSTNRVPKGPCEVKVALFIDDGVGRHPAQRVGETKECPQ
ncbi:MAG: hypothetical protein A2289_15330 [Deltaproteobacteria bacterium RIFOXYA12_FULL_58_15]|nr:MAG: hypothetical protein A2289_15330 [Deltaproteobacteria bacterium RIFOXYA12_FULL_58_15]OGR13847.1 MAG: hypothetical protein A2341_01505 [Deltaproteobacteria bacterium RIFOXYB12_FULL_58_9]